MTDPQTLSQRIPHPSSVPSDLLVSTCRRDDAHSHQSLASAAKVHPIDERAQAMELRDRFRRATTTTAFVPGMVCREKRGMAARKTPRLVMFWRWLDPSDPQDAIIIADSVERKAVTRTDCIVGFLDHDGDLMVMNFESWRLEPCDAFPDDEGMLPQ